MMAGSLTTEATGATAEATARINLAYMTSCRWVDCSFGGLLESLAHRLRFGTCPFSRRFNLVAVMLDDTDEEYRRVWENQDLWPRGLEIPVIDRQGEVRRQTLEALTVRISSGAWRRLKRKDDEPYRVFQSRKAQMKMSYERAVLRHLGQVSSDLILIDSYLPIAGPELLNGFRGRIVNVHPAITESGDPLRLPGRHPTRDTYTRAAFGLVIVDDKRRADIPKGEPILVECDGVVREAVKVDKTRDSGVTVHVVDESIDSGPVILCERYSLRDNEVSLEGIRRRNQTNRKDLVPRALLAYTDRQDAVRLIEQGRQRRQTCWPA